MQLTRALEPLTSLRSRLRGAEYFRTGAVVHFDPQPTFVYAVVHGSEDYVVRIDLADDVVRGTCTCPFFNDRLEPCKHLWAVALMCDARAALQLPDSTRPATIDFEAVPLDDETGEDDWSLDDPEFHRPRPNPAGTSRPGGGTRGAGWRQALAAIAAQAQSAMERPQAPHGHLLYVIDLAASRQAMTLVVHLLRQEQKQNGEWGLPKPARLTSAQMPALPESDRIIIGRLSGARPVHEWAWSGAGTEVPSSFHLRGVVALDVLPVICETGRCRLALTHFPTSRPQDSPLVEIAWLGGTPFKPGLRIVRDDDAGSYNVDGTLERPGEAVPLAEVQLLFDEGLALTRSRALPVAPGALTAWLHQLLERGTLRVPVAESARLREALLASGASDIADLPEELRTAVIDAVPVPHLVLRSPRHEARLLHAELLFSYAGGPPQPASSMPLAVTADPHVMARRTPDVERKAHDRLRALGAKSAWNTWERRQTVQVAAADVPRFVRLLVREGWHVEADGHRYRVATSTPRLDVKSGLDWFELRGDGMFDGQKASLPQLLDAIHKRQGTVLLGDGTFGVLPEEWMREIAPLGLGSKSGDHVRFARTQVALLDALLAARPDVAWDEKAAAARERLRAFDAIAPVDPPATFAGTLRPYQREGLGWLMFLREFGFGGCLADDMGLGKTVVVLALLDARRQEREDAGQPRQPSLVVVPRSVLFNWQQEAARFAPRLRLLDFSGADRASRTHQMAESDLVLVTYGTLRRDAVALAEVAFDYAILDEAQAIKNANTAGARAARVLNARHRLALSGTPIENRLDDLWSLFEFLNPGLLSGATAFGRSFSGEAESEELQLLARGLRPFILRRTKGQVASDLPPKSEQTIFCELERRQRTLYNELRDHYRRTLLGGSAPWQQSKLQVLEALLRLRQAACHPALVDPERADEASAKLDLLLPRLVETVAEGHKALVFSQFTSFLALLRTQLNARGIVYEYLDGRTRDREARVARFQNDADCRLFLISLKAGGVGLNLTAADYVFILDPWWNPAAEAQAVDRAHRIGQTRNVLAYRLIARDTVEERVLALQQRKRELAEAIITADNSVVKSLRREDLELLLS
ncbi:MAG TPA: DEAD/DEAH box helicase [Vicinamibacterales bacterium]|nr:DEAD/DEAH box helicase [Vicinamibacterales bacterium]